MVFNIYVGGGIFASPSSSEINQAISDTSKTFYIKNRGTLEDFIVLNVEAMDNIKINLSQPHLIDHIF